MVLRERPRVLNFRNIPYTQSWISYPDIAPILYSLDAPLNGPKDSPFTHTASRQFDPPRSYPLALAVDRLITHVIAPGLRVLVPPVAEFLDPKGREYFVRARSLKSRMPLREIRAVDEESFRTMVDAVKKGFAVVVRTIRGRREDESQMQTGPLFVGAQPGYADFIVVAFFGVQLMSVGEDGEARALWNACLPWLNGRGEEVEWDSCPS
ncbi:hypothetical protein BJX68DRAFT_258896 [Aspergillus pseudodeflectus]|uniref:Glutathione S-transferase UstS-like C-terminal domain-containing protein n=1 Tax=Aspergillus pseudodeflectus TaxID=176178 RepID=A0ABR4JGY6_9EURO